MCAKVTPSRYQFGHFTHCGKNSVVVKIENVIFGMHFVFAIKYVYLLAIKYVTKHLTSRICLSTVLFDNCNFKNTCVSMRKIALNLVGKTNS